MANRLTPNTRQEQDAARDPAGRAKALHDAEQRGAFDRDFEDPERLAKDGKPGDLAGGALKKEQDSPQDWKNNVTAAAGLATGQIRGSGVAKSKSPLVAIIIIIFGGGFTFMGLLSAFSLLPIQVLSQFFDKGDAQNTSLTIRTNKIINDKISKDTTTGYCTPTKSFLCKYEKPSNKLLKALSKEGVKAFDSKGNVIEGKGLGLNARPDHFEFTDSKGVIKPVTAKEFSSVLASDPEFRAAFHNAYTPRFIGYADSIFKAIKARFGFTTNDKNSTAKNEKDVTNNLNEHSAGPETGASTTAADEADGLIKKEIEPLVEKEVKDVAKSGKGNTVGLVAGAVCMALDVPSLIVTVVRAYQLAQLIDYGVTIVTSIEAWKAGDASPQEASAIGDLFTSTVGGQSAMDSFGIKSVLFGDTQTKDTSYQKFSPGSGVVPLLGPIAQITNSPVKTQACSVATNPATGLAIDAATSETVIGPILNALIGTVISVGLQYAAPPLIQAAFKLLPSNFFQPFFQFFLGDLTKGLVGKDVGNAFSSGLLHLMGQTANRGGNMALTIKQKLAYDNTTAQVNLAYAQEDRATLSPFDASNPNTMLGSFVNQLLPYYSNMGSISGVFSTLGSMVTGSVGSIIKQSTAGAVDASGAQYSLCNDPSITNPAGSDPIAAGPFCNIEYGIPPQYLNKDPEEVANDLIASGDINPTTGDVNDPTNNLVGAPDGTSSLSGWISLCTDGSTTHAADCELSDTNVANNPHLVDYALYTIDQRVRTTMDGEDPTLDPPATDSSTSTPAATATPTDTTSTTPAVTTTDTTATPPSTNTTTTNTTTTPATPTSFIPQTKPGSSYAVNLSNLFAYILPPKRFGGSTI